MFMQNVKGANTTAISPSTHMSSPVSTAVSDYAKCTIYHTGIEQHVEGIICGDRVYALDRDGLPGSLRDKCWWATDEPWLCGVENGLMQLEVDGKWGYVQADTDKIIIAPVFDYAGPFCGGYAHVAYNLHSENARELLINDTFSLALWFRADCREPGGQHGFINKEGKFVIPCEYDDASDLNNDGRFIVVRDGKCGVVDQDNQTIVDFRWNRALYYGNDVWAGYVAASCDGEGGECRWALLGKDGEQYYEGLTEKPDCYYFPERSGKGKSRYLLIRKGRKFGVACSDGRPLTFPTMLKREAVKLINHLDWRKYVY